MSIFRWCTLLPFSGLISCATKDVSVHSYGEGLAEKRYEVVAQPHITWPKERTDPAKGPYLAILADGKERELEWRGNARTAKAINPQKVYRFELIEAIEKETPSVLRILDGEKVIYDGSICEVHHKRMTRTKIPVSFGTPSMDFIETWETTFPHLDSANAGCIVNPKLPRFIVGWVCADCVRAEQKWQNRPHPEKEASPKY